MFWQLLFVLSFIISLMGIGGSRVDEDFSSQARYISAACGFYFSVVALTVSILLALSNSDPMYWYQHVVAVALPIAAYWNLIGLFIETGKKVNEKRMYRAFQYTIFAILPGFSVFVAAPHEMRVSLPSIGILLLMEVVLILSGASIALASSICTIVWFIFWFVVSDKKKMVQTLKSRQVPA